MPGSIFDAPRRPKNYFKGIAGSTGRRKSMMNMEYPLKFKSKGRKRSGSQKRKDRSNRS